MSSLVGARLMSRSYARDNGHSSVARAVASPSAFHFCPTWARLGWQIGLTFVLVGVMATGAAATPRAATGTLVAMVPSQAGLVVAADSRATINGVACDTEYKIVVPTRPARTVISITGNGKFFRTADLNAATLCQDFAHAKPLLDIGAIVKTWLEAQDLDLTHLSLAALSATCLERVRDFARAWPNALASFSGREMFSVVLAAYDPADRTALIRNFVVAIAPETSDPSVVRSEDYRFAPQDAKNDRVFGEGAYFEQSVVHGPGQQFFDAATKAFIAGNQTVAATPLDEAVDVATNLVAATERTTALVPAQTGIGGPIDVVLLGEKPQPEILRWKK